MSIDYKCAVCYENMTGKIFNCSNGHNVCDKCYLRVDKCPICRDVEYKRNTELEEQISKISIICPSYGCTDRVLTEDNEHKLICKSKHIICPLCQISIRYTSLLPHLEIHNDTINYTILYNDELTSMINTSGMYVFTHLQNIHRYLIAIVGADIKMLYVNETDNPIDTTITLLDDKKNKKIETIPYYNNEIQESPVFTILSLDDYTHNISVKVSAFDYDRFKIYSICMIKLGNSTYRGTVIDQTYNPHKIFVKYSFLDIFDAYEEFPANSPNIREAYSEHDYTTSEYNAIMSSLATEESRIEFSSSIPARTGPF